MFDKVFADEFWAKLSRGHFDNDCWLFQYRRQRGYFHVKGAPYFVIGNRSFQGHCIAYCIAYGPISSPYVVRHRCGVSGCCNPAHLIAGTQQQNSWDRWARELFGFEAGDLATYEDIPEWIPPPLR